MEPKYYIWSKKHTHGINCVFWEPNESGYTINLNEAGVYSWSELRHDIPVMTRENFRKLYSEPENGQSYAIAVEDVEMLGKKMICILN